MDDPVTVLLNDTLNWSRGKRSAHAVHAVLTLRGVRYGHAVRVLGAKPRELESAGTVTVFEGERPVASAGREHGALVIRVFIRKSEDRDVTARRAVAAALAWYPEAGRVPELRFVSSDAANIAARRNHIRDAGRTELEPGTVTAVAVSGCASATERGRL